LSAFSANKQVDKSALAIKVIAVRAWLCDMYLPQSSNSFELLYGIVVKVNVIFFPFQHFNLKYSFSKH